jgi:hypothetical protein
VDDNSFESGLPNGRREDCVEEDCAVPAERAEQLGHIRTRLAAAKGRHMLLGRGCACGMPAGHIDPVEIDAAIVGHLASKYRSSDQSALAALFEGGQESLSRLIDDVIEMRKPLSTAEQEILCSDLEPTVSSLEELGGIRGSFRSDTV